ncbi:hypothetical protein OBBRIDRAFT_865684 [Obba rivulosa]|uniref:Arrestin-like N-terminal domain-containing protein n=1 Tax=Obba rivulosa TaxID=1052685 RepID=A0A8E2AYE6_9APHY|nr:hypothetical protein OBBRIDRAFT_865684 [Obba rivulosa]
MSTTSLPSYVSPSLTRIPSYSAEPHAFEQRLALSGLRQRPTGDFVKQSKSGGVRLRLTEQEDNVSLPVYGNGAAVEGTVNLAKPENVTSVEVQIEGSLKLQEVAEGGTTTSKLCLSRVRLWSKDGLSGPCPATLPFSLTLPTTYSDGRAEYPLPPTHQAHLSGVPGFNATIEYTVSAIVQKNKAASLLRLGNRRMSTVSTPFVYYPRSRPAVPLPPPMAMSPEAAPDLAVDGWECFESIIPAKSGNVRDIIVKLYIPASRVFCMSAQIPFYLTFKSTAMSLAAFLPFGPVTTSYASSKRHTRIQLLRQTTVDVRNALVFGTKTDIWRVSPIGEGKFRHAGDGRDWIAFSGDIRIEEGVKIGGFRASGFSVKDCIVLSMLPLEGAKSPFKELRRVVPLRLATDPYSSDGFHFAPYYSEPATPEETNPHHFSEYQETT